MEIPIKLNKEIELYCKANNITDVDSFILKMLTQGFNIEKYGITPNVKTRTEPKYVPLQKPIPIEEPVLEKPIEQPIVEEKKKNIYDED